MSTKEKDRKFILECIELYKNLPALWNVKSKEYSNRTTKNDQYQQLLQKYKEKYPEADKEQLVKKFNSLRTNFRKELKRIKNSEKSGAGTDDIVEPKLWYFEEMRFLESLEVPCTPKSSMQDEEQTDEDAEGHDITDQNNKEDGPKRKKVKKKDDNQIYEKLISLACQRLQQPESDYQKIALSWAVELEKMQPLQQLFAKKAINEILFEGQMGTLHRDSVQINKTTYLTPSRKSTPISVPPPSPIYLSVGSPTSKHTTPYRNGH